MDVLLRKSPFCTKLTQTEFGRAKLISHIRTMIYQYMEIKQKERFQKLVTSPTLASK